MEVAFQDKTDELLTQLERPLNDRELRILIANSVAANARAEHREDVRSRKLTIATGSGTVHDKQLLLLDRGLDETEFQL